MRLALAPIFPARIASLWAHGLTSIRGNDSFVAFELR